MAFVDERSITVSSGHGGRGAATFRREKYVPRGGPDGGDGGSGGDVVFAVRSNLKTLAHLYSRKSYRAADGGPGQKRKKHGKDGEDLVILVPPGTLVRDESTGLALKELPSEGAWTFLKGGKGGRGNTHFTSSVRQAPRYAQPGLPGETAHIRLELRLVADVGLIGFPNAGKSTLLSVLTNARPRIGDYPFTTTTPVLGVLAVDDLEVVMVDIPGIIEGAAGGAGLGLRFLKHISRAAAFLFLIDLSGEKFLDEFGVLLSELRSYDSSLIERRRVVVGTKLDTEGATENLQRLAAHLAGEKVLGVSALTAMGISDLKRLLLSLAPAGEEAGS